MKNKVTNWLAGIMIVLTSANAYFETMSPDSDINWITLISGVVVSVVSWYTGKDKDGKKAA